MATTPDDPERILTRLRPAPDQQFVADLELRLQQSLRRRRAPLRRPGRLLAGAGLAGALATAVAGLSIAGALPLDLGRTSKAAAERECTTVTEWRLIRRPRLDIAADGRVRVTTETVLLPRQAIRCH
jgi:hypothetical protein